MAHHEMVASFVTCLNHCPATTDYMPKLQVASGYNKSLGRKKKGGRIIYVQMHVIRFL